MTAPDTANSPAGVAASSIAFVEWLGEHKELVAEIDHVSLGEQHTAGYDVSLYLADHTDREEAQRAVERFAAALGADDLSYIGSRQGFDVSDSPSSAAYGHQWQWGLSVGIPFRGQTLVWSVTAVQKRPADA